MKVFITAVDRPLGHNIARIFSNSKPGATLKNSDEELEENTETQPNKEVSVYNVVGTMSSNQTQYSVSKPGTMHYSGIQKRDALRKEALQKFNIAGVKPTWVSHIFDVCLPKCNQHTGLQETRIHGCNIIKRCHRL